MKNKDLLNHMHKRMWIRKTSMTDRSLGLVMLVAAVAGVAVAALTKRTIKRMIFKISIQKSNKARNSSPQNFMILRRSKFQEAGVNKLFSCIRAKKEEYKCYHTEK